MVRRFSLLSILLLCLLAPAACSAQNGSGCPGSVTASLTGVIAAGPAGTKRGISLPPDSRTVIGLGGGSVTWKAQHTGTAVDNKTAKGDLPPPVTTTTVEATTTTTNISFGPTTSPAANVPAARTPAAPAGRSFTASTTFGNQTLTVKGSIVGPPAPCHGIGSWSVTAPGNSQAGGGSWSF